MSVTIRVATGDRELRDVFALRHRTFVGEGILDGDPDSAILFDVFDALPSSHIFVAVNRCRVVGTVRTTFHTDLPAPSDDFGVPVGVFPCDAVVGSGSMLCVHPDFRNGTLGLRLVTAAMAFQYEHGTTHGVAPIRPEAVPIFARLGWYQIADTYVHLIGKVPVVPMGLELAIYFEGRASRPYLIDGPAEH